MESIMTGETIGAGHEESGPHTSDETAETDNTGKTEAAEVASEQEKSEAMQEPLDQPDTAASTNGFPLLTIGTHLLERYEITQVISESPLEHVYQVIDHQGFQHCWNCGSEQNAQGDEFCSNCGASMLDVPYVLHEYSTEQGSEDEHVMQGVIVNTFIEQGHTYVIEQPQVEQSPFPNGVQLLAASNSDAGDVRRSEPNEDSTLVLLLQRVHESMSAPSGVFIVADGLGGHDNGQVASRMTINIIAERMVRELLAGPLAAEKNGEPAKPFDEDALVTLFHDAIEDANAALCQKNQLDKTDMGSTITGFMVVGEHATIINVGDSRTYMLRGKQLYQLTTDHSLVGQLVASGLIEPDDVYTHPQRSQIYRSLGDKLHVQIDTFKQQLQPGDILLSCSDGLWEMVRNPQIESILENAPDPETACAQFIEAANANGGEDNVSAVIVFVR
jgi:serine/threonine protein phosphatase PrpC